MLVNLFLLTFFIIKDIYFFIIFQAIITNFIIAINLVINYFHYSLIVIIQINPNFNPYEILLK